MCRLLVRAWYPSADWVVQWGRVLTCAAELDARRLFLLGGLTFIIAIPIRGKPSIRGVPGRELSGKTEDSGSHHRTNPWKIQVKTQL